MTPESDSGVELQRVRHYYAEEIRAVCNLRSPLLYDALNSVPREKFLPQGPWLVRGADYDIQGAVSVETPDSDPARIYHNVSVAVDRSRHLYNGQPATIVSCLDKLDLQPGHRIVH